MPENTEIKRKRALPRQWKRFLYLEPGDGFFIGRCRYVKVAFFYAVADLSGRRINLPPWRKVQTDVLVRDARPGGKSSDEIIKEANRRITEIQKSSCYAVPVPPNALLNDITHFVGDDCPGGHADKPVNNDNNITGPTS